ncbi:hypothetical protein M2267_003261 [Ensifer sp. KUDG1]|uniref:PilZ domain-containing protein n=1 Tax=unclassified Ensifer TaxID=2633371 RepID=UPI0005B9E85A|nr:MULTISPECIES: PilZ domain-containing protein [unclassified Ensifer]MBD9648635.1 PilZ domain-containing protein [Ensifer sp. ENS09]QRY69811.1 PilZ domain-containing protein [Ensifer sp. PDNC004]
MQNQTMYSCVPSPFYERRYERFSIGHAGTLTAVQPGLGSVSVRSCRMIDISRGGASFAVDTNIGLPQHYYLHIVGTSLRIGCAEVYRNGERIGVQFIKPIEQTLLREIIRQEFFTGQVKNAKPRR